MTARKIPIRFTEDMRRKIGMEYARAKKNEKAALCAHYNVSMSSAGAYAKAYGGGTPTPPPPADRTLEELLWAVVIAAQRQGDITVAEARRLLELVK